MFIHIKTSHLACKCPITETKTFKIESGESTANVNWSEPMPDCNIKASENNPQLTKGRFSKGHHTLDYIYIHSNKIQSFELTCQVKIQVTGILIS